ncbi:MAG: FAD-dependent oxidoreductase [Planctomycetia bacterium]|nr:FAD-dependent oxidoreductase [Planctomycetia bacterium]
MTDCCIIGGGIIGLSIARELAGRGVSVRVLSRDTREEMASWAAVGIFPPAPSGPGMTPNAALTAWSDRLHRVWARELLDETGIDNGLRRCGGLHLAADEAGLQRLRTEAGSWLAKGACCEVLDDTALAAAEPALAGAVARGAVRGGLLLADEHQFRSPRQLRALEQSCLNRGVVLTRGADVSTIAVNGGRIMGVVASVQGVSERVEAATYVVAAGAWSGRLAEELGLTLDTRPIRGQIVLLRVPRQPLTRIVNLGLDYIVPREDGNLLVGSTLEDAGYVPVPTDAAILRLRRVAVDLLGDVADVAPEKTWAGLRPGSPDGLPFIGRVPALANAFVAAGHFRAGLHQSTGTAVMISDLIQGRTPEIDPTPFGPSRRVGPPGDDSVPVMLARAAAELQ